MGFGGMLFLICALVPLMYFRLLHTDYGLLSIVAWVGLLGLIGGVAMGLHRRRKSLLWFLIPTLLSHFYFVLHLVLHPYLYGTLFLGSSDPLPPAFIIVELTILLALIIRLKGARMPAALLSVFCGAYTLIAIGVANM